MAFEIKTTKQIQQNGVKCLVYGQAGTGKTSLTLGLDKPLIVSAERGLLSISGESMPELDFVEVKSIGELRNVYMFLTMSEDAKKYKSVAIDSISEIAELCKISEKAVAAKGLWDRVKDPILSLVRDFRDMTSHDVLMIAQAEKSKDELGATSNFPAMPSGMGPALSYFFDETFASRITHDPATGTTRNVLQTYADGVWDCKDRSGKLDRFEVNANPTETMRRIFGKIRGTK